MNIENAILGLLSWKALSGYDLKKIFEDSVTLYWSGNNNEIYRSLLDLRDRGLVACEVQPQESLPARKVYSITPAGMQVIYFADQISNQQIQFINIRRDTGISDI